MTSKIKFVTDSVCDIPAELVQKWDISVVPCFVNYGGKSYADDGVELDREAYFRNILAMKEVPTTAAPPPTLAQESIEKALADADHVFVITTPAKVSGIYNSMRLAIQNLTRTQAERVTLIDSGQLSMGIGLQVLMGAEVAQETGNVHATHDAILRIREHQHLYTGLATMELLRRSGRVGWAAANIGALLQIKPVISVKDGDVVAVAKVRTFSRAIEKVAELARSHSPFDRVALMHINNHEAIEALRTSLKDLLPAAPMIVPAGPTIGTHIGPGAIAITTVSHAWKA